MYNVVISYYQSTKYNTGHWTVKTVNIKQSQDQPHSCLRSSQKRIASPVDTKSLSDWVMIEPCYFMIVWVSWQPRMRWLTRFILMFYCSRSWRGVGVWEWDEQADVEEKQRAGGLYQVPERNSTGSSYANWGKERILFAKIWTSKEIKGI